MFVAKSYFGVKSINPFIGLADCIESDNIDDCIDFIWNELQHGSNCILEYGTIKKYYCADLFNTETVDVYDCEVNLI